MGDLGYTAYEKGIATGTTPGDNNVNMDTALKKGDEFTAGAITYRITSDTEVTVKSISDQKVISIPEKVSKSGRSFRVTEICSKAAYGNKKLQKLTIPSSVKMIRYDAFNGCSGLKKIVLNGSSLTYIGTDSFKDIKDNAVVKIKGSNKKSVKEKFRSATNRRIRFK